MHGTNTSLDNITIITTRITDEQQILNYALIITYFTNYHTESMEKQYFYTDVLRRRAPKTADTHTRGKC